MIVGVASLPPSLIPSLRNIGILLHKQATKIKHSCPECTYMCANVNGYYFVTTVQNFVKGQLCALRRQYLVPSAVQSLLVQSASLKGKAKQQSKCPN